MCTHPVSCSIELEEDTLNHMYPRKYFSTLTVLLLSEPISPDISSMPRTTTLKSHGPRVGSMDIQYHENRRTPLGPMRESLRSQQTQRQSSTATCTTRHIRLSSSYSTFSYSIAIMENCEQAARRDSTDTQDRNTGLGCGRRLCFREESPWMNRELGREIVFWPTNEP